MFSHYLIDEIILSVTQLLKTKSPILVALDGRSGTGKSTIATMLASRLKAAVVVSDDFYAGGNDDVWEPRSAKEKVDKVIDWRRLRAQALEPLLAMKPAHWHPLDFQPGVGWVGWKDEFMTLNPAQVIIVDGAYSARPELADLVDLAVLVETDDQLRRQRLLIREGQAVIDRWHQLWDPAEDYYFNEIRPRSSFELVITNDVLTTADSVIASSRSECGDPES